jgi:hypothetical protein
MGGLEGGAGNDGIGGGREKAGWLELPAESVRGGGLLPSRPFCILRGPTAGMMGVSGLESYRKKSSSSGRPCLRPSMAAGAAPCVYGAWSSTGSDDRRRRTFGNRLTGRRA